ncbi:MAG: hypothetical protein KatS3mg077_1565 [Candidatus Binatia bacterium]|nr:MAG: hypothetical protein KatS3mg077_1565 [Candidatus Binatia bacterium]
MRLIRQVFGQGPVRGERPAGLASQQPRVWPLAVLLLLLTTLFAVALERNAALLLQTYGCLAIGAFFWPRSASEIFRPLVYSSWWFVLWHFQWVHPDFHAYMTGAGRIAQGLAPWGPGVPYLYPPLLAQVLFGLTRLFEALGSSDPSTSVLWLYRTAQWVALVVFCEKLALFVPLGLALLLPLAFEPLWSTLWHTQVTIWIGSLLLAAISSPAWLGALCAGVAIHLKLYGAVILVVWALAGQWRRLVAGGAATVLIAVVSFQLLPPSPLWSQWWAQLSAVTVQRGGLRLPGLFGVLGWLGNETLFGPTRALLLLWVTLLGVSAEYRWRKVQALGDNLRCFRHLTVWMAAAVVFSPFAWHHVFFLTLPLLAALLARDGLPHVAWPLFLSIGMVAGEVDVPALSYLRGIGTAVAVSVGYTAWLPNPLPLMRAVWTDVRAYIREDADWPAPRGGRHAVPTVPTQNEMADPSKPDFPAEPWGAEKGSELDRAS